MMMKVLMMITETTLLAGLLLSGRLVEASGGENLQTEDLRRRLVLGENKEPLLPNQQHQKPSKVWFHQIRKKMKSAYPKPRSEQSEQKLQIVNQISPEQEQQVHSDLNYDQLSPGNYVFQLVRSDDGKKINKSQKFKVVSDEGSHIRDEQAGDGHSAGQNENRIPKRTEEQNCPKILLDRGVGCGFSTAGWLVIIAFPLAILGGVALYGDSISTWPSHYIATDQLMHGLFWTAGISCAVALLLVVGCYCRYRIHTSC